MHSDDMTNMSAHFQYPYIPLVQHDCRAHKLQNYIFTNASGGIYANLYTKNERLPRLGPRGVVQLQS